jgi:FGGY-family pentulose kinase
LSDVLEDRQGRKRAGTVIRSPGETIGPLTPAAAQHLGLSPACRVGVGIIDAHAGGIGLLGAAWEGRQDTDSAVLESVLALIGGTSNCHMAASRAPLFVPGVWGPYFGAMVPGTWLTEGGQSAAGALIDYAIENHAAHAVLAREARDKNTTVYALLNDRLQALADARHLAHPAYLTRDLHVLDYHLGNRSPIGDPHARGVVDGLSLDQSVDSLARLYLATVQAVAYGTRAIVEALNTAGFSINALLATGGGTKNPLWLREHADACQTSLTLGREPESVLLGAAILGAAASGAYPDVVSAMKAMGRSGETIAPDPVPRAYHDAKFSVYHALYDEQNRHRAVMRAAGQTEN